MFGLSTFSWMFAVASLATVDLHAHSASRWTASRQEASDYFGIDARIVPDCDGDKMSDLLIRGQSRNSKGHLWLVSQSSGKILAESVVSNEKSERSIALGQVVGDLLVRSKGPKLAMLTQHITRSGISANQYVELYPHLRLLEDVDGRVLGQVAMDDHRSLLLAETKGVRPSSEVPRPWSLRRARLGQGGIHYSGESTESGPDIGLQSWAVDLGAGRLFLASGDRQVAANVRIVDMHQGALELHRAMSGNDVRIITVARSGLDWNGDGQLDAALAGYRRGVDGSTKVSLWIRVLSGSDLAVLADYSENDILKSDALKSQQGPGLGVHSLHWLRSVDAGKGRNVLMFGDRSGNAWTGCYYVVGQDGVQRIASPSKAARSFGGHIAGNGDYDGDGCDDYVVSFGSHNDPVPSVGFVEVRSGATHELLRTWKLADLHSG